MSISDDELKQLAIAYRQLVEFIPFQVLVKEMEAKVEDFKESNINTDDNDLKTKGLVAGIRYVLGEPVRVVAEFDDSQIRETI